MNPESNPDDPLEVQYGPKHPINLVEGGLLHRLAGSDQVMVNSLHSQGVAKLADGVTVEAVAEDGLIELHESGLEVTPAGRLLLRAVAMAFDQYLPWDVRSGQFSRVI